MKKLFLMFFVSLCFGVIAVVLWTGPANAQPFNPPIGGLVACRAALDTCNADLSTCNVDLGSCPTDLNICNADLAACEAGAQVFPGDGVENDPFDLPGHGPALSYTDNEDGTFTDNNTKFMWEIKDQSGGVHDVGNA